MRWKRGENEMEMSIILLIYLDTLCIIVLNDPGDFRPNLTLVANFESVTATGMQGQIRGQGQHKNVE